MRSTGCFRADLAENNFCIITESISSKIRKRSTFDDSALGGFKFVGKQMCGSDFDCEKLSG